MPDDGDFLRYLEKQLHLISSDCFDLKAKELLRLLQQKIAHRLVPSSILTKDLGPDPAAR